MKHEELSQIRQVIWDEADRLNQESLTQKNKKIFNLLQKRSKEYFDAMNIFTSLMNEGKFNFLIRKRFVVVDTKVNAGEICPVLGQFDTQEEVDKFIESLPEYITGRYGVDDIFSC